MASLEKDLNGIVLPTRRNADIIQSIFNTHKDPNKVVEIIGKDYYGWVKAVMFDPRKETVFFSTPEYAQQAGKRIEIIETLDQQYKNEG